MRYTTHELLTAIQQDMAPMGLNRAPESVRDTYYSVSGIIKRAAKGLELPSSNFTKEEKMKMIMSFVSKKTGIPLSKIVGKCRKRGTVQARQSYCYLCNKWNIASLGAIGETIYRDHTTVIHSRDAVQNLIDTVHDDFMWVERVCKVGFDSITNQMD